MNFTPGDCLFGSVKWTKNADPDKNGLSGYKIGFNASSQLCSQMGEFGTNVDFFGVYNSSSVNAGNRIKDILVFGKGPADGLDDATIRTEAKYCINITKSRKTF